MATDLYKEFHAGDLITAEDANKVQSDIKKDIDSKIKAASDAIVKGEVAQARNAKQFDSMTPDAWKKELMKIFALREHDHEGALSYQRYFLELETVLQGQPPRQQPAVIIHNMGRHPIVQVYELLRLPKPPVTSDDVFAWCGPSHADVPQEEFMTQSWDERHWGDPIDDLLQGMARGLEDEKRAALWADFQDNFVLGAWLSNLEKRLFEPGPGQYHFDVGDSFRTSWIKARLKTKVETLKNQGEWPPRFIYRPVLLDRSGQPGPAGEPDTPANANPPRMPVDVFHLNLNEIELQIYSDFKPIRLMVLLRG